MAQLPILITGFGPFSATDQNPSADVAKACGLPHRVLEVSWRAVDAWIKSGEGEQYGAILHLGFADRPRMTPELFAQNRCGTAPDVDGISRPGPCEAGKPVLRPATLWPAVELPGSAGGARKWQFSMNAGTYLCNYLSYRSLGRYPNAKVGFLHVPHFKNVSIEDQINFVNEVAGRLA